MLVLQVPREKEVFKDHPDHQVSSIYSMVFELEILEQYEDELYLSYQIK